MSEKIIDPTEIIVDQPSYKKENLSEVNPWVRFLSRFTDYACFGIFLSLASFYFFPHFLPKTTIPLFYLLWVPLEALFLSKWGYTPGKFLLKTVVRKSNKTLLDFRTAFRRSLMVWFRGIGMGIPILNIITLLFAYGRLKQFKTTSWDRDEKCIVVHYPVSSFRMTVSIILIAIYLFLTSFGYLHYMEI